MGSFWFFLNSIFLGAGLAMDAFSVSLANGLAEPGMRWHRRLAIAGVFAAFQSLMPLVGWVCVQMFLRHFSVLFGLIPWISLVLLSLIGGNMILGAAGATRGRGGVAGTTALLLQGLATSLDALSVGFTGAALSFPPALLEALIIGGVTLVICLLGLFLGRRFGERYAHRAGLFGGVILILVGIEIFLNGIF